MEDAMTVPELKEMYFSYLKDNVCGCNFSLLEGAMTVPELTEMYFSYLNDNGYRHVEKHEISNEETGVVNFSHVSFKRKNRYYWISVGDESEGGLRFSLNIAGRELETDTEKKYALHAANVVNRDEGTCNSGKAVVRAGSNSLGASVCLLLQSPEQFKDFFDRTLSNLLRLMIVFEERLSIYLSEIKERRERRGI
jgi:hypothetical protein